MKPRRHRKDEYRLYFTEDGLRYFLGGIVEHEGMAHLYFMVKWSDAMTFADLKIALSCKRRLLDMGYRVHIE